MIRRRWLARHPSTSVVASACSAAGVISGAMFVVFAGGCGTQGALSLGSFSDPGASFGGASAAGGTVAESGGGSAPDGGEGGSSFTEPGGSSGAGLPACETGAPLPQPAHRYDFSGSGKAAIDLQGGAPAELVGTAELTGVGQASLDGDGYVNLPNGLLGDGPARTLMVWTTPQSGPAFWRIFDLGSSSSGEDPTGTSVGTYYIVLTPETGFEPNGLALLMGRGGPSSEDVANTAILVANRPIAVAVVVDDAAARAQLYFAGEVVAETALSGTLAAFDDVNNWLGRSQYAADPNYRGTYDEFRVYDQALSACEVSALTALGPDDPG